MVKMFVNAQPVPIDHIDVAVLTRVNDLAGGFGIRPDQFGISYFRDTDTADGVRLSFDTVRPAAEQKSFRMLEALGLDGISSTTLEGPAGEVLDILDAAIRRAPSRRHRRG